MTKLKKKKKEKWHFYDPVSSCPQYRVEFEELSFNEKKEKVF